jgi:hypothetical protein
MRRPTVKVDAATDSPQPPGDDGSMSSARDAFVAIADETVAAVVAARAADIALLATLHRGQRGTLHRAVERQRLLELAEACGRDTIADEAEGHRDHFLRWQCDASAAAARARAQERRAWAAAEAEDLEGQPKSPPYS